MTLVKETKDLIETRAAEVLMLMDNYDPLSDDYEKLIERANVLIDMRIDIAKVDVEERKLENDIEVERIKQSIPGKKIALETFKTAYPTTVNIVAWMWGMCHSFVFETTNRFTSKVANIVLGNTPKINK